MTGEALRRQAHRERNGWGKRPIVLRDDQLVRNVDGLRRLCAWLGIPTDGGAWDVAPAVVQAQPAAPGGQEVAPRQDVARLTRRRAAWNARTWPRR